MEANEEESGAEGGSVILAVESKIKSITDATTFTSYTVNFSESLQTGDDDEESSTSGSGYNSDTTWPDVEMPGTWGTYGLEDDPWNDEAKPVVRFKTYENLVLTEEEERGVLTERIMACCASYLDRCPEIGKYVLCKVNLSNKRLEEISILTYHHYIQFLNLSHNNLTDLEPLSQLPFLMYLDVSNNILTEVLKFKPPFNLTYVNYSHNFVDVIDDLGEFWSLVFLDLSHNQIYYIRGLDKLRYLRYLNLSFNQIKELRNLNNMRLVHLNIANNQIEKFEQSATEGLHTLKDLVGINISYNNIKSMSLFKNVEGLQKIVMVYNNITHLIEFENLKNLRYLTEVDFRFNPVCTQKRYYEICISLIKPLVTLDGSYVSSEEKVLVKCKYDPPPIVEAARKRANLLLIEKLMKYEVNDTTIPINKPVPPILILVGPQGSGQRTLLSSFYEKYNKYLKIGVSHTTRPKRDAEVDGSDYYFVTEDQFKELTKQGEFIAVSEYMGYSYGFACNELMKVIDEKRVLIFHTDLIAALSIRMKSLRPILILTLFIEEDDHYARLLSRLCYTRWRTRSKEKTGIMRIVNDYTMKEAHVINSYCSDGKEFIDDVVDCMPGVGDNRQVSVSFHDNLGARISGPEWDHQRADESNLSQRRSQSVSFHVEDEKVVHSISEGDFENPILSAVSEYGIYNDSDETSDSDQSRMDPSDHVENYIKQILESRKSYINFHEDNPGFFWDVIYTDKPDDAMSKLGSALRDIVERKKEPRHTYTYETDPCFEEMLTDRLNVLYSEMYSEVYVSEDQQPKCWQENTLQNLS